MTWTPERTWSEFDMMSAGRMNTMVRDNLKLLRLRPAFRAYSIEQQAIDADDTIQRLAVGAAEYDKELVTLSDGYYDVVAGSYITARRGVYNFGAQAQIFHSASFLRLTVQIVREKDNAIVASRSSVNKNVAGGDTGGDYGVSTGVTCIIGANADDAFRADVSIKGDIAPPVLLNESNFSSVVWGHWIKDWNPDG